MNRTVKSIASFQKCISSDTSDGGRSNAESASSSVVKKKLCRVSNGYTNGRDLLKFTGINESADGENNFRNDTTMTEGVVREIGGDHLVEISVVRGNNSPKAGRADSQDTNLEAQKNDRDAPLSENSCRSNNRSSDQRSKSISENRRKRVAFLDAITVHNFENEDDSYDLNSENMFEMSDEPITSEPNEINLRTPTEVYHQNPVNTVQFESQTVVPKKTPLRRLVFGQVSRAYNKANLFRSLLRDSLRRQVSAPRERTPVARTKSLADRSVRHSFIKVEDPNGTHVQLVVPLGPHYMPNGVSVTISGDGKKIKVLAIGKKVLEGTTPDDRKHDYHECFYLPKAISPLLTRATVDSEGYLKIDATFATSFPSDVYFDKPLP